jgi:hypothetical protein
VTQRVAFRDVATNGQWEITYFFDTNHEVTDNFEGYIFEFGDKGVLTAATGSLNHTGSWSVTDDGRNDDSNDYDDIDFNISFTPPPDFEELTEDWEIISISDNKIELKHVSGGGGGTDLLTFEKI